MDLRADQPPQGAKQRLADIVSALRSVPDAGGWLRAGAELLWSAPLILAVAYLGDLIAPSQPPEPGRLLRLGAGLLIAPALGEEILFRAGLIPRAGSRGCWLALSVVLFVLWHPLQSLTIGPPWAAAFMDPWFLLAVAILGIALGRMYIVSGSVWPGVLAHWVVVLTWKVFLGGPF